MYFIGVDLGGTKILTAVADDKGKIIARENIPTEADKGQDHVIENINKTIKKVIKKSGISKKDIVKIGVGSPGPLNSIEGIIYESANLPFKNLPIVEMLEESNQLPVKLENDANAAALGEKWFGAGKDVDHMIYITVSTGVGGGIIIDKRILQGRDGAAGEVGHMIMEPEGPICGCGNYGCLESLASGTAIARRGRESLKENRDSLIAELSNNDPDKIDAILVAQAAFKGDKTAIEIYETAGHYLGIGLANLINLFNTEKIIFGGGVNKDRELFNQPMMKSLKAKALPSSLKNVEICDSALASDTGVKGAIAVAMEEHLLS